MPPRRGEVGEAIRRELGRMQAQGGPLSEASPAALESAVESAVGRALGGEPNSEAGGR